jgi:hypothetical protein
MAFRRIVGRAILPAAGFLAGSLMFLLLAGCASPRPYVPTPVGAALSRSPDYIDLSAGFHVRAITPILKSGGYQFRPQQQTAEGNTVTLSVGPDFLGYETSHYEVKPRRGTGVEVVFTGAEVTKDGVTTPQPRSIAPLFQLPRSARFVRLIYLIRVSEADHNMALAAADRVETLEALTRQVKADPTNGCKSSGRAYCSWIPEGIAVRAER